MTKTDEDKFRDELCALCRKYNVELEADEDLVCVNAWEVPQRGYPSFKRVGSPVFKFKHVMPHGID